MALGAFLLVFLQLTAASMDATTAAEGVQPPSCNTTCGEVEIPYPFGVGDGCYADEYGIPDFKVSCDYSADPPRPFIGINVNILSISVGGRLRIKGRVAYDCYDREGNLLTESQPWLKRNMGSFRFSHTENMFVVIGCDSYGYINGTEGVKYFGGCSSICLSRESVREMGGNCSGMGCCETAIPRGLSTFHSSIHSFSNHRSCWEFNPCGYAFLVEKSNFTFNVSDIERGAGAYRDHAPPVVVDWFIGNQTCREVQARPVLPYACRSNHSECFDSNVSSFGYNCKCEDGFEGNPYLRGGCRDIDECRLNSTICPSGICTNTAGSYNCRCNDGFEGNPRLLVELGGCRDIDECRLNCNICPSGSICTNMAGSYYCTRDTFAKDPNKDLCLPHTDALLFRLKMGLGIGLGIFLLIPVVIGLCWGYDRRKLAEQTRKVKELKQKLFEQNGGPFLQEMLLITSSSSSQAPAANTFRIFTEEELAAATNGFDEGQIVGRGGHGIVYRGRLQDDTEVAIKKSRMVDERQSKEFAREIGILSQINHVNVVKLLGCCLEVEIPMLVYQYVPCGTLYDFIHRAGGGHGGDRRRGPAVISLVTRMRIATEAAEALAYLHSYASRPILHGDVKTANILLDEHHTVKVSDFGASTTLAPVDEVQLATVVQGTCGYLDPEYLQTYRLTTKSDVYSFGVVLAELLTGKKPIQLQIREEASSEDDERGLAVSFVSSLRSEKKLMQILDAQVVEEGEPEMLWEIAVLACRCLSMAGDDRPTMKEVVTALQVLRRPPERPWSSSGSTTLDEHATEESESLLAGAGSSPSDSTRNTTRYLSMQNDVTVFEVDM